MKVMYKPSEYEMKLIVLYVIRNLKTSASYTILDYVISSAVDLNYFDLQKYIDTLIESENLSEYTIDNSKIYSITVSGEETIGFFADRIPRSIRDRLDENIRKTNEKANASSEISSDYYPINSSEYAVKLCLKENNVTMMSMEIYIGDKDRAKKISEYFSKNTTDVYMEIIHLINQKIDGIAGQSQE